MDIDTINVAWDHLFASFVCWSPLSLLIPCVRITKYPHTLLINHNSRHLGPSLRLWLHQYTSSCLSFGVINMCSPPPRVPPCRPGLTMSWLLAVWISLGFLLLCQATLYQTIQQHHVARPGRTDILTLGTCTSLVSLSASQRRVAERDVALSMGAGALGFGCSESNSERLLQYVRVICHSAVL